jgi:hypothetical protein
MTVSKIRGKPLIAFISPLTISTLLIILFTVHCSGNDTEASIVQSNPFWMPLEFDIGKGYFKANVFIAGLKEDAGIIKICVNSEATNHTLCHYMSAVEEGQIVAPGVSVHAGIFVFPSSHVPVNTDVNVCVTILKNDEKTQCKTIRNSSEAVEEMVDIYLNR